MQSASIARWCHLVSVFEPVFFFRCGWFVDLLCSTNINAAMKERSALFISVGGRGHGQYRHAQHQFL